jgi:VIT1/CCC1 family predicted Fe2+/Mn2+ transporter
MTASRLAKSSYLRNFIFGVEDSLVSTVGLLSGIAIAGVPRPTILLTGIILVLVEGFSMAAGSFLSETSVEEYEGTVSKSKNIALIDGVIMFVSYVGAGMIPLVPYTFFTTEQAFTISISLALITLFILGMIGAFYTRVSKRNIFRRGVRMCVIGGIAIAVGVIVGRVTGV